MSTFTQGLINCPLPGNETGSESYNSESMTVTGFEPKFHSLKLMLCFIQVSAPHRGLPGPHHLKQPSLLPPHPLAVLSYPSLRLYFPS